MPTTSSLLTPVNVSQYPQVVTILIDGDSIAYEAAYAAKPFLMRRAVDNFMGQIISDCTMGRKLKYRYKLFIESLPATPGRRYKQAKTQPYKGNRTTKAKPWLLKQAKLYMEKTWRAQVIVGQEVDDLILDQLRMDNKNQIIAHVDKDLLQESGIFYNYNNDKRRFMEVTPEQAEYNLAKQMIMGDSCDHIPGIPKVGERGAEIALKQTTTPIITACELYAKNGLSYEYLKEQFRLLYCGESAEEAFKEKCITKKQFNEIRRQYYGPEAKNNQKH